MSSTFERPLRSARRPARARSCGAPRAALRSPWRRARRAATDSSARARGQRMRRCACAGPCPVERARFKFAAGPSAPRAMFLRAAPPRALHGVALRRRPAALVTPGSQRFSVARAARSAHSMQADSCEQRRRWRAVRGDASSVAAKHTPRPAVRARRPRTAPRATSAGARLASAESAWGARSQRCAFEPGRARGPPRRVAISRRASAHASVRRSRSASSIQIAAARRRSHRWGRRRACARARAGGGWVLGEPGLLAQRRRLHLAARRGGAAAAGPRAAPVVRHGAASTSAAKRGAIVDRAEYPARLRARAHSASGPARPRRGDSVRSAPEIAARLQGEHTSGGE